MGGGAGFGMGFFLFSFFFLISSFFFLRSSFFFPFSCLFCIKKARSAHWFF